jgi:hypothetical protein
MAGFITPVMASAGVAAATAILAWPLAAQEGQNAPVQASERWQITLPNSEYIWDIQLVGLRGDSLVYRRADSVGAVPVDRITEIRLIRKTEMQLGAPAGGAIGALTGAGDEIHDFMPLDFAQRIRALQEILLAHPPQKQ